MTQQETEQILIMLYNEVGKDLQPLKVATWAQVLAPVPYELGVMAAREMIRLTKVFGEPQLADYREHVNRLYRDAKRALRPRLAVSSAEMARMSPGDRESLQQRHAPSTMTEAQARRILDAVEATRKALPKPRQQPRKTLEAVGLKARTMEGGE